MKPKTIHSNGISYARYALGRQIYDADVYPFSSTNGSRIVVCGHEQGLLFLWKSGTPSRHGNNNQLQRLGSDQDVDMTDGNGLEASQPDQDQDVASIEQQLDLPLGTAVLHISFPSLPQLSRPQEVPLAPKFLQKHLIVAAACADGSVRLLTLPLDPPSPALSESKRLQQEHMIGQTGKGTWGESMVTIPNAHQNVPRGIAMAFASRAVTQSAREDEEDGSTIDVLLASVSEDLSGTLLIHRVPLGNNKNRFGPPELWRSRQLSAPASHADVFVPTDGGFGPRILVSESNGVVRIFEGVSARHHNGEWSLSLFAPITKSAEGHPASVINAKWILNGQAIIVLMSDASWGIWDISTGQSSRGLSGARPTPFTVSGRVGNVASAVTSKSIHQKIDNRSQLAPMTPGTRKIKSDNLFSSTSGLNSKRGGIAVKQLAGPLSAGEIDESLILWHGDNVVYLPSIRTYWQSKFKGASSLFTTSASGTLRDLPSFTLGSEARISVSAFLTDHPSSSSGVGSSSGNLDLLIAGERSLILTSPQPTTRLTPSTRTSANQSRVSDQSLLSKGLLDVEGLDRMLTGMSSDRSSTVAANGSSNRAQKRVLFQ